MKRVLSLVLALVLVLGMIPTFAADATGAQNLYDNGFITGKDGATVDAKLDVNAELSRAELAALIAELNGAKEEAAAFAQPADFTDADMFQDWAKPFIAYAQENTWMNGYPDGSFGADKAVPANQLAAVLLNALGYDFDFATVLETAADLGIVVDGDKLTRGEAFEAMWTAVSAVNVNGEEMTLGVKLGKLDPPTPVVTDVMIDSVTATNLKEIVVKFNQVVDKATVVAANFSLSPAAGTLTPVLGEDGMTVTITTGSAMTNQGAYKLTAEKVANADEMKLAKIVTPFTAFDATLPTVESIVVTGPKTFDVMFSEPIVTTGTVTVKSANTTLAVQSAANTGTNKVTVTLYTALVDGTTYDVTVKDYADAAGYKNVIKTIAYTYAKDNTAPTASIVSANQQYVVVEFNKPVTGLDLNNFYHTFSAWKPMGVYATKAAMDAGTPAITTSTTNVTTVYIQFATTGAAGQFPLQPGSVNVNILGKVGSVEVKDNWGNALATTALTANIVADLEAPTVTKVEASSNTTIDITFSKAVDPGTVADYSVLNTDGTAVSGLVITGVSALSTTKVQLTLDDNMIGKSVLVNVKNIVDTTLNKNKLAGTSTTTITFADQQFDGVSRVEYNAAEKVLYVVYAEAMNDTAINVANYKLLDGATVRSLTGATSFFSGNTVVKIELSATEAGYVSVGVDKLLIANAVKDLAGNSSSAFQIEESIVAIGSAPAAIVANGVKAIDKNTVTVQFNQELVSVNPADFQLNNGGAFAPTALALTTNSTGTLVTLTFGSDIAADVPGAVTLQATFSATTVNVFDVQPTNFGATAIVDKIAPSLVTKELTGVNTIVLNYSEAIKAASVSLYTYTVAGNTVTNVVVGTTDVTLTLGTAVAVNATPSVTQALDIEDLATNKLAPSAAVTVADKIAPSVTTQITAAGTITANGTHVLAFSEALDTASKTAVKAAVDAAFTETGAATVTSAWDAAGTTLTVTIAGWAASPADDVTLAAIANIAVTDLAGNTSAALDVQL